MSRSRQAALLARHLTEVTGVRVELQYDTGTRWNLRWTNGPLEDGVQEHLDAALTGYRYTEMRDRTILLVRTTEERAWAARAVASRREGTLAPAVVAEAAHQRARGVALPRLGQYDPSETHEYYALLRHVEDLCRSTPYPERASVPEDEPVIEQLLAAGTRERGGSGWRTVSQYDMAKALLAAERAPAGDQPPRLRVVRAAEEGR